MLKKVSILLFAGLFIGPAITHASAATVIRNGVACSKQGATATVKVKGVSKAYVCTTNPAAAKNPAIAKAGRTWTLKTCVSYYSAYKASAKSISDQRDLVNIMTEPDKSTYNKELDKSQADLNKVLAAIENNHCKTGL
jgi:hypothetical protein